jgi:hypothetical protein
MAGRRVNPLTIDRRPRGMFMSLWLVRRTTRRPIMRHTSLGPTAFTEGSTLHAFTFGARFAIVVLWQRGHAEATA